jgi:hypothetical protein
MTITKVFDKSSPLLFTALTSGERLTKCTLKFYRTSADGQQEHYFTIELEDAIIVDIKSYMPNCQDPAQAHFTHLEDVSFTYRKITWSHEVAGTSKDRTIGGRPGRDELKGGESPGTHPGGRPFAERHQPCANTGCWTASVNGQESEPQGDRGCQADDPFGPGAPAAHPQYAPGQRAHCRRLRNPRLSRT